MTEVGRQPWVIYGFLKTADALTPMSGLWYSFGLYTLIYVFLVLIASWLLYRQVLHVRSVQEVPHD